MLAIPFNIFPSKNFYRSVSCYSPVKDVNCDHNTIYVDSDEALTFAKDDGSFFEFHSLLPQGGSTFIFKYIFLLLL